MGKHEGIAVRSVSKIYRVPVRQPGLSGSLRSLFRPDIRESTAVDDISFTIGKGEMVGFIGPNGAGKTTTLKMLSGLLHPTSGSIQVMGYTPAERKEGYLSRISLLMGNKSQLNWDHTVQDSFAILREIYGVPYRQYQASVHELTELLELGPHMNKMARNLSLGERAKCELAASLLHQPDILFLDEPTLGLDVTLQLQVREFIKGYNKRFGTTVLLTSHYMHDIEALCPRIIMISKGKLIYDGELAKLSDRMEPYKLLKVSSEDSMKDLFPGSDEALPKEWGLEGKVLEAGSSEILLRIPKEAVTKTVSLLLARYAVTDLSITDPPVEAVIDRIYREGVGA